ncbi:MAG: transposase [Ardenticatenia bacterium]|nr:transposase [Ardenticatenia bacterium]
MARNKQTQEEVRRNLINNLNWQAAERDDKRVAQAIHEGEELDAIYNLNEVGLLDGFFHFLKQVGIFSLIEEIEVLDIQRVLIAVVQFVLLYMLAILFGIASMNGLPPLLFSNTAAMKLVGFNAHQIANGFTRRGDALRKNKPKQGPLSPQCLAQNICKIPFSSMERFFNGTIRRLAAFGILAAEIGTAIDGTPLVTTENYEGCGCLKVERRARQKDGSWVTVIELIFGWKLIALIDIRTRIPLAIKVVQIQKYEGRWIIPLVKQAQENLASYARIVKVVADRIYLDGEDLWELDQMGLIFVVIAKDGMLVKEESLALAAQVSPDKIATRARTVRHGHGSKQTTEKLVTRLAGLEGLTSYGLYGPEEYTRHYRRKEYAAKPINTVVVLEWDSKKKGNHVYLTNGPVDDPFVAFDDYDDRSLIENCLFREGKGPWNLLKHFPQRNERGVLIQTFFIAVVQALATAYRLWDRQQELSAEEPETAAEPLDYSLLGGEGAQRWRRRLKQENRNKLIVFVGEHYGIFHTAEFAVLVGLRVKEIPPELGTPADILARFDLGP